MRILILDDRQERHDGFRRQMIGHDLVHVFDYYEAVKALDGERFDLVCLDHDLDEQQSMGYASDNYNGADVAKVVAELPLEKRPLRVRIHSWNHPGATRIASILHESGIDFWREPFTDVE